MTSDFTGTVPVALMALGILGSKSFHMGSCIGAGCTWLIYLSLPRIRLGFLLWPRWRWESLAHDPSHLALSIRTGCIWLIYLSWFRNRLGFSCGLCSVENFLLQRLSLEFYKWLILSTAPPSRAGHPLSDRLGTTGLFCCERCRHIKIFFPQYFN